jgi:hypothetical protein
MSGDQDRTARRFRPASLDALNFLLSDVRGALGPYLNVFLVTQQHWSQSKVGLVTALSGWLGLVMQTPIGAAIDTTPRKREAMRFARRNWAAFLPCAHWGVGLLLMRIAKPVKTSLSNRGSGNNASGDRVAGDPRRSRVAPLSRSAGRIPAAHAASCGGR